MDYDANTHAKRYAHSSQFSTFGDDGDHTPGERALWRAVITQALMDISSNSKKMIDRIERARALAWFSLRNQDFIFVCALADLDPKYVMKKVKEAISRNCKWRKDPNAEKKQKLAEKKKHKPGIPCTKNPPEKNTNQCVKQNHSAKILQFA